MFTSLKTEHNDEAYETAERLRFVAIWFRVLGFILVALWIIGGVVLIVAGVAWPETSVALGLLFALLMTDLLLVPNPYMPQAVRMAHLRETAPENFVLGWLIGWLLGRRTLSVALPQAADRILPTNS